MAWIKTVPPEAATGRLKRIYDEAVERAGRVYNILGLQSLNPTVLQAGVQLYTAIMHAPSSLSRAEREMIATAVSSERRCFY
jgi:alkylhydroperoxidase family enzyme